MNQTYDKELYQTVLRVTGQTGLLEFLYGALSDRKRSAVKALLEQKQIAVNGSVVTKFDYPLAPGTEVFILKKAAVQKSPALRKLAILFEDDSIIVIDKSSGLLSVSTDKETGETAFSILKGYVKAKNYNAQLYVVHRLDRDTSGVMMFSKSREIQQQLQNNWEEVITKRIYYAVVEGNVQADKGEIISWLKENKALKVYSSKVEGDGQKAVTHYRVLRRKAGYTLLEVELETGRKNQIRVHCQDLGHSIAGDRKYGAQTDPLRRLALHAGILEFPHPLTGKLLHFETPVPPQFEKMF
jgi:23S rRNA pseudouridine1911/1915/1917 synthase